MKELLGLEGQKALVVGGGYGSGRRPRSCSPAPAPRWRSPTSTATGPRAWPPRSAATPSRPTSPPSKAPLPRSTRPTRSSADSRGREHRGPGRHAPVRRHRPGALGRAAASEPVLPTARLPRRGPTHARRRRRRDRDGRLGQRLLRRGNQVAYGIAKQA